MKPRTLWYRLLFTEGDVHERPSEDLANTPRTASVQGYWKRDREGNKIRSKDRRIRGGSRRWEAIFVDPASTLTDAEIVEVNNRPGEDW